jgi:hypothetical protein
MPPHTPSRGSDGTAPILLVRRDLMDESRGQMRDDERELCALLIKAAEHLGQDRPLPEALWKEMQARQKLAEYSRKSDLQMSGPIE